MYQTLHRNPLRSQWRAALHNRMRRRTGLTAQAQIALILALLMAFGPAVPLARAQSGPSYVPQEACPNSDCENMLTVDLSGIVTNPVDPTVMTVQP
jgi:hypothetical protein